MTEPEGVGYKQVITNTPNKIWRHFLTPRNMFIIAVIRFYRSHMKPKHRAALPPGGNINVTSSIYNSRTSQFFTSMLSYEISLFGLEDSVQLWHFYSGEVTAITDSSYYGEWQHTHTHTLTSLRTCIHASTHTNLSVSRNAAVRMNASTVETKY